MCGEDNEGEGQIALGVGAGFVLNRQLYYGDNYGAGEIGHIKIVEGGDRCRCGNYGCLETLINCSAFIQDARKIMQKKRKSILNSLVEQPEEDDLPF